MPAESEKLFEIAAFGSETESVQAFEKLITRGTRTAIKEFLRALCFIKGKKFENAAGIVRRYGETLADDLVNVYLRDLDFMVREGALYALGILHPPQAFEAVLEVFHRKEGKEFAAAYVLAKYGKPGVDVLLETLEKGDWAARCSAVVALSISGDPRSFDAVVRVLKEDESPEVRRCAAESMERYPPQKSFKYLFAALRDPDAKVVAAAAWSLRKSPKKRRIIRPLARFIMDKVLGHCVSLSDEDFKKILQVLAETKNYRVIWVLMEVAAWESSLARFAMDLLKDHFGKRAVTPLIMALPDDIRYEARWWFVYTLAELAGSKVLDVLIRTVRDIDPWVGEAAADALGELGDPRALKPLLEVAADEHEYDRVRRAAKEAAERIKRKNKQSHDTDNLQ